MNSFKKLVLTGTLVVSSLVGAGVVSAAPNTVSGQDMMWTILQQNGITLASHNHANRHVDNQYNNWPGMSFNMPSSSAGQNSQWGTSNAGNNSQWGTSNAGNNPQWGTSNTGNSSHSGSSNAGNNSQAGTSSAGNSSQTGTSTGANSSFVSQVVSLTNQERAKAGLQALSSDTALAAMALDKAKDMYTSNYFDHNSPKYGSPFNMMTSYGIHYSYAGENIAKGQQTPQEVMTAWMNSAGHRANILNSHFTKIGVAYYNGEWVQEFIAN
jgi:uncharacterized YkwD family protein